jgi:hypothetical protein
MNKFAIFSILMLFGFVVAATYSGSSKIEGALCEVYCLVSDLLPVLAFVLFVLAGVAYAAGQFFGAEMRAKAIGLAMNMITGAIIGLILSAVGPNILTALGGATAISNCTC